MRRRALDPAPRRYAASVALLRRSARPADEPPAPMTLDAVNDWLLGEAGAIDDTLDLFEALTWRLVGAGVPLDRASLHVGTLHPQLFGYAWVWNARDRLCDEIHVDAAALQSDAYKNNPVRDVLESGITFRSRTDDEGLRARYPILADLAQEGIVEYIIQPLGAGGAFHNSISLSTRRAEGFEDAQITALDLTRKLLALHVSRHIVLKIAANLLDTYVGSVAGGRVLDGAIRRGSGEAIRSVIWMSDLRGFTQLSDRLDPADATLLLNAYFERLAGALADAGGEILKFMGDGVLAIFPLAAFENGDAAAAAALRAARDSFERVAALSEKPPPDLAHIEGWAPLRTGIALHEGSVFFGNIGSPDRLDFTVIGQAVNTASRLEALTKPLGRALIISEPVARRLEDVPLEALGPQSLRGLAGAMPVFAVPGL